MDNLCSDTRCILRVVVHKASVAFACLGGVLARDVQGGRGTRTEVLPPYSPEYSHGSIDVYTQHNTGEDQLPPAHVSPSTRALVLLDVWTCRSRRWTIMKIVGNHDTCRAWPLERARPAPCYHWRPSLDAMHSSPRHQRRGVVCRQRLLLRSSLGVDCQILPECRGRVSRKTPVLTSVSKSYLHTQDNLP